MKKPREPFFVKIHHQKVVRVGTHFSWFLIHFILYHIISYQISFSSVPVQIFQAVISLSPSICLQFLVGFAFGTFSAQLAPCIASCVETRFKRTVKSKVENHGKFIFWHLQVRFFFPSFCTCRCIFFATRSTPHFFNPTILQGTDVWKDLRLSCRGHWGHDRISHPLILRTCVVVVGMSESILCCQQQLFPQHRCLFHFPWMILVVLCLYNLHGRLVSNFLPCKAAVIRDLPRQEQLNGDEVGMFGCTTGSGRKALIFCLFNVLLNGDEKQSKGIHNNKP